MGSNAVLSKEKSSGFTNCLHCKHRLGCDPSRAAESLCHPLLGCPSWKTAQTAPGSATTEDFRHFVPSFSSPQPWSYWSPWPQEAWRTTADKWSISMPKWAGWRNSVLLRLGRVFSITNMPINTYFSAVYTKKGNFRNLLPTLQPCPWNALYLKCTNSSLLASKPRESPALSLNSTLRTPKGFYSTWSREQRDTDNSPWHAQPHTFSYRDKKDRKVTFQAFRTTLWFN